MGKFLNILLLALAIARLGQSMGAATGARNPTLKIVFVKDMISYLRYYIPEAKLSPFNYNKNEGFTLGSKWDNILYDLDYEFDNFRNDDFLEEKIYTYPGNGTVEIKHVQLVYKNTIIWPQTVLLAGGGIGQEFISFVVQVPRIKESTLSCKVVVSGEVHDIVN